MKRILAILAAVTASALVIWRLMRRVQHLQAELARSERELASQRARAMEAERQLAGLTAPAAAPAVSRGVVASNGFIGVDALRMEAAAAAADLEAAADAQALDELLIETDLPLAEVEVLQTGAETAQPAEHDLTLIDGIGPVFAARLREHGIVTFSRLAETSAAALAEIIQAPAWRQPDFNAWTDEAAARAAGLPVAHRSRAALTP